MIDVDFSAYRYFPALRTRQAELKGLEKLDAERKAKILPTLTLGRWPKALDFSRAAEKAAEAAGGHFILDLTSDGAHLANEQAKLRDPAGAFSAWRAFVAATPAAIPVVQAGDGPGVREFIKQAQEIERATGRVVFRIRDFSKDTTAAIGALSALDDVRNALVLIDCQFIRPALVAYVTACISTINALRAEFPELVIAVLGTSFPQSTVPFADASGTRGSIDILERTLHARIGGYAVAAYGDHGSVHSVVYDDAPIMRWAARVDYPRDLTWYFERRPSDQSAAGYVSAAQAVVALDPDIGTRGIWGEDVIVRAAAGDVQNQKAPGPWISVRVNIHLARQIDLSARGAGDHEFDDEDGGFEE
jgi:hypothetical protein